MVATPAVEVLISAGTTLVLHEFEFDPTQCLGRTAAPALRTDPGQVLKTPVCEAGGHAMIALVPVTVELDCKAMAQCLGAKRVVISEPNVAERVTGCVIGAISPLGQKKRLATVLDTFAVRWRTVFVSGGRRGLEIELSPDHLVELTDATVATIARSPRR